MTVIRHHRTLLLATMLSLLRTSQATTPLPTIKIGVVSSPDNAQLLAAAAEAALADSRAAPHVVFNPVEPGEPLDMPAKVCAQALDRVSAIVSAGEPEEVKLAAAAAARDGVPLLLVTPTSLTPSPESLASWEAVHMYPRYNTFIEACAALCKAKGWRSAVLLHEGPVGARLVQGVADAGADTALLARRLPLPTEADALRNLLLVLKKADHTQFVVWCDEECCDRVLTAAQTVGLLAERHSYILLALDLHTLDLEPYSHGGANITGLQLFNPEEEEEMMKQWRIKYTALLLTAEESMEGVGDFEEAEDSVTSRLQSVDEEAEKIVNAPPTALVLTYDVVQQAALVLIRLGLGPALNSSTSDCTPEDSFLHADTLINYLRSDDWAGRAGARRAGLLHVVELARGGFLLPVGKWDPRYTHLGVQWTRPFVAGPPTQSGLMANRTFTVLIAISKPYVMNKMAPERLSGNDRYEGFCIELISKLSKQLHFNYTLVEQPGGDYEAMMLKVSNSEVDFAITDLTITAEREQKVDFTTPFMNLGISILYKKPTTPDPKLFAFMLPFSTGVWFCLGVVYVGTSLVLYVVGRLCPEEWQNPYPCIEEPEALENQFTLSNALWFTLGAILCQGSEIAPVAYGSRAVASAWWIFALVITSSYTANLATLLAKKNNNQDFTNVNELANNTMGITYGAKINGSTYRFFNYSQDSTFQEMFKNMEKWGNMPLTNELGIQRVEEEPFAFLMESTSIEYNVERNCNLTQVGGLLDSKGYGIAMKKDSSYRQALNLALLNLQEAGELRDMKRYWWKEVNGGGSCNAVDEYGSEKLEMKNFVGLFLVLGTGCVLGIFISLADLMVAAWRSPRDPTATYLRRLGDELRFVFHFQLSEKPVHGPLLPPPTPETESIPAEPLEEEQAIDDEGENMDSRLRSASFQSSGLRSRRRSSIHNASVRLARHARQRDASTPARTRRNDV